tara:strand:- start:2605 stop:3414 length:810 start_codon:yes stop_codon:yes gene_type:complete
MSKNIDINDLDLSKEMRDLLSNNKYFVPIKSRVSSKEFYSDSSRSDPDDNLRDMNCPIEIEKRFNNIQYIGQILSNFFSDKLILTDLGCGQCPISRLMNIKKYYGIDIHINELNDTKYSHLDQNSIHLIESDLEKNDEDLNYLKTADVVISHHVIEHLEEPVLYLKRIVNSMNKDSIFVIGTPDFDCAMARLFGRKFRLLHDPSHISLFSTDSLARLCRDIGLKIERIEYPYFDTPYFCDVTDIKSRLEESSFSPPYYGNMVTFFCRKL